MNASFERPYRPVDLNIPMTKGFPLVSMAEKLMEEANSATSGRASLTLAHGTELTLVLVALKAGTTLEEHQAPAAATVITLSGSVIFTTSAEKITLEQGEAVTFTADSVHAVYASEGNCLTLFQCNLLGTAASFFKADAAGSTLFSKLNTIHVLLIAAKLRFLARADDPFFKD